MKHFISILAVLICGLAWWSGYISAGNKWWWTVIGVLVFYPIIYRLLDL